MKHLIISLLLALQPVLLNAGIDNYLFPDRKSCLKCLKEIYTSSPIKQGESFKCKGQYGDKPQNKYYVMRYFTQEKQSTDSDQFVTGSGTTKYFFKHDFLRKQQNGLNKSDIEDRCPITHEAQSQ